MKDQPDGLTIINSQPLISPEKIRDKTLDQLTLPERTDLLREAYQHIEGEEVTSEEMEVVGMLQTKVEEKIGAWSLVVRKVNEAADLCKIEQEYFQKKANEAKARGDRFQKKIDGMHEFIRLKMIEFNLKKIETPLLTVSLRKRPQVVEFIGDPNIESPEHSEFVCTTVSRRWDKKAIKAKLSEGQLFESVKLSDPDFSISIKGA